MRVFVAIDLNRDIIDMCMGAMSSLKECDADIRFTNPENLHITMKFLGEVREECLDDVYREIERVSREFAPFRVVISGIGYFGKKVFPRVVWAGISEGRETLFNMSLSLEKGLSHIRKDSREPNPHITLARIRSPTHSDNLIETIMSMGSVKLGEVYVKEIKLKASDLNKNGPVYSDLKAFSLVRSDL